MNDMWFPTEPLREAIEFHIEGHVQVRVLRQRNRVTVEPLFLYPFAPFGDTGDCPHSAKIRVGCAIAINDVETTSENGCRDEINPPAHFFNRVAPDRYKIGKSIIAYVQDYPGKDRSGKKRKGGQDDAEKSRRDNSKIGNMKEAKNNAHHDRQNCRAKPAP